MNDLDPFRHLSPGRILCGAGTLGELPGLLDAASRHLVVTDPGLVEAGAAERVLGLLSGAGIEARLFGEVRTDPTIENVEAALAYARAEGCTAVVGLGGGSSLDAAKALAARMTYGHELREYGDGLPVPGPIAPLCAIPTTAGTGSEATRVAVVTDTASCEKMAIRGEHLAPLAAVLDPELLISLPRKIAAETAADALTHAAEAYLSRGATPISDALALGAIGIIGRCARRFVQDRTGLDAGGRMLAASCMAGQAFSNAGLGLVHSLGEPLGAHYHVSHGLSCALFLPVILEFNAPAVSARLADIEATLECGAPLASGDERIAGPVPAVRRLLADLGLPASYAAAGIEFELKQEMLDAVWPQSSTRANPRTPTETELRQLYLALA